MNQPTPSVQEKLWLGDEHDQPVGEGWQLRSSEEKINWRNFRVINAFIRNRDGKLWIPRRTASKAMFPLCLDVSVGGHVEYGESYEETFYRETMEEVGVDATKVESKLLGYLNPNEKNLSAWMKIWEIHLDDVPAYNHDDFVESFWLTPDEFRERMKNGDKAKSDLPTLVDIFYP